MVPRFHSHLWRCFTSSSRHPGLRLLATSPAGKSRGSDCRERDAARIFTWHRC